MLKPDIRLELLVLPYPYVCSPTFHEYVVAYISPTTGGICKKNSTKHHDWGDETHCITLPWKRLSTRWSVPACRRRGWWRSAAWGRGAFQSRRSWGGAPSPGRRSARPSSALAHSLAWRRSWEGMKGENLKWHWVLILDGVQLNFAPKIYVFYMLFEIYFYFLVRHLLNSL